MGATFTASQHVQCKLERGKAPYHGDNILLDLGRERDQAEESGEIKLCAGN